MRHFSGKKRWVKEKTLKKLKTKASKQFEKRSGVVCCSREAGKDMSFFFVLLLRVRAGAGARAHAASPKGNLHVLDEDFALRNVFIALPSFPDVPRRCRLHRVRVDVFSGQDGKLTRALRLHLGGPFLPLLPVLTLPPEGARVEKGERFPRLFFFSVVDSHERRKSAGGDRRIHPCRAGARDAHRTPPDPRSARASKHPGASRDSLV